MSTGVCRKPIAWQAKNSTFSVLYISLRPGGYTNRDHTHLEILSCWPGGYGSQVLQMSGLFSKETRRVWWAWLFSGLLLCGSLHWLVCVWVQAANYLDIKGLLDVTCKTVANMIKGKSPEEIRKTFNIKNDFTPAEEEQVSLLAFFRVLIVTLLWDRHDMLDRSFQLSW